MYIFKSVFISDKSSESHALKAEPGEVKCKLQSIYPNGGSTSR
jgi:hypothetical protein